MCVPKSSFELVAVYTSFSSSYICQCAIMLDYCSILSPPSLLNQNQLFHYTISPLIVDAISNSKLWPRLPQLQLWTWLCVGLSCPNSHEKEYIKSCFEGDHLVNDIAAPYRFTTKFYIRICVSFGVAISVLYVTKEAFKAFFTYTNN